MTFLAVYHTVKCQTEAVNNLSRSIETYKILKISCSKLEFIKISESVIPHQTLFQHQFAMINI